MFSIFSSKRKPYEDEAFKLYKIAMTDSRNPELYSKYGVEDNLEGRFELLCLHVVLFVNRLNEDYERTQMLSQALFDSMFADMDQSLRQIGIGDMGIPKRMKYMMKSFNGRIHVYSEALEKGKGLEQVLERNVYEGKKGMAKALATYVRNYKKKLDQVPMDMLVSGNVE